MVRCCRLWSLNFSRRCQVSKNGQKCHGCKRDGITRRYYSSSTPWTVGMVPCGSSESLPLPAYTPNEHDHTSPNGSNGDSAYWQSIPRWKAVSQDEFLNYGWQVSKDDISRPGCEPSALTAPRPRTPSIERRNCSSFWLMFSRRTYLAPPKSIHACLASKVARIS